MKKNRIIISVFFVFNFFLISKINSQDVNQFTGGFSYSVPLISVPSPYGPSVNIGAGYGSGIGVEQNSSEIGLGWGINAGGAISRGVSGIPDDWNNKTVADPSSLGFKSQGGLLWFNNDNNRTNMDFYSSNYKIDTQSFYFPNYDDYSVSGPGISGTLEPHLFDFATTELGVLENPGAANVKVIPYTMDPTYGGFNKNLEFNFGGDFGGNFKSRHYPTTPINGSTSAKYPGDTTTDSEYGSHRAPYVGVSNVGYDTTTNRLATAKYVTYTSDVTDGITGFTITDESGFVYYYNQPVYINSAIFGNYPLDNDYKVKNYASGDTTRVTSGNNYYIKDNSLSGTVWEENPYMIEWKQDAKYAYKWLLTAVKGPDYVDANGSGGVNAGDKGYWVVYDWQKWSGSYIKRTPEYGFNYSFSPNENEKTQNEVVSSSTKVCGKYGSFSKYNQEIYYLNKIQTSSHTAIFVRDVRLDGYSSEPYNYDNQYNRTFNIANITKTTNYGTLYDDGGQFGNYTNNQTLTTTISPTGATSINIRFNSFDMASGDSVRILNASDVVIARYSPTNLPPQNGVTFSMSTIKVQEFTNASIVAAGFRMSWSSVHTTVNPQLKITKVVLFTNEDFATLNLPSASSNYHVSTSVGAFDVSTLGKDKFYNETWYNHADNKSNIEAKSIQTVDFNQDYSLSRRYVNNVKTIVTATDKFTPISDVVNGMYVASADYASSGKLTLNEITTYGVGHTKTSPSIIFDYNKSITTDNPNYNPVKVDYSGFYKSDASAQGYNGYTTTTSKDSTDAWSLRKITTPLGGTIEINYESNEYEKVFDGNGGFRGPSKMYGVKSFHSPTSLAAWKYVLEENISTPSDFTSLKNSPPAGTVKHIFIPLTLTTDDSKFICSDTFNFSGAANITSIENFVVADPPLTNDYYVSCSEGDYGDTTYLKYTGNGYFHFDLPIGTPVYAGGIRVKSIVSKNGTVDSYTTEYSYSEGVTPMEPDRFAEEKKTDIEPHYIKLRAVDYDKHRMGPNIGYTQTTVKSLGQNNISNGSEVTTFITSENGIDNFKVHKQFRSVPSNHPAGPVSCATIDTTHIIEIVDKYSGYYGQVKETKTLDINNNIISKTVNEYTNLEQGAVVENYDFFKTTTYTVGAGFCREYKHVICIKRDYPVVLSKQTNYSQGISSVTEYLKFDAITMTPTEVRTTSPNKGIKISRTLPAFRISQNATMGPKSISTSYANILSPPAYSKTLVDTSITLSSDFDSYSILTYKKNFNVRMFSVNRNKFIDSAVTNKHWIADRNYEWVGDSSSIDNYGLFKNSSLVAFDYTLASINKKWKFENENTLLDNSGHIIEAKGFNNRFVSKKYGYGDTMQIAEASNVNFSSWTYSGFESAVKDHDPGAGTVNFIDGEVKINSGVKFTGTPSIPAHTGTYLMKVPSGTTGANSPTYSVKYISANPNGGLLKGRTYRASVWVHTTSPSGCQMTASYTGISSVSITKSSASNVTIGDWILMNLDITVSSSPSDGDELKVFLESSSGDAYFDDLRIHPVDASVSATVYEPKTNRISATLDQNNFATIYKYDAGGKVTEVWQEIEGAGLKKVKKYQYNFARGL